MLSIDIIPKCGMLFVRLNGILDEHTVNKLNTELTSLVRNTELKNLTINISNLKYLDLIGIRELSYSFDFCNKNNGISILCGMNNKIKKVLNNSSILNNVYLAENEEYALRYLERKI